MIFGPKIALDIAPSLTSSKVVGKEMMVNSFIIYSPLEPRYNTQTVASNSAMIKKGICILAIRFHKSWGNFQ